MIRIEPLPKISCMMVTTDGRMDTLKRSYRCYLDQNYSNRELLIVTDGSDAFKDELLQLVGTRPDVRFAFLDGKYTLGALRNVGVGLCFGDLFVQWDDDDFCAPGRLAVQCGYLLKHRKARMCFFSDQLHYYFPTRQLFWNDWKKHSGGYKKYGLIPGTIMAYTKGFSYRYPASGEHAAAGEDSVMTTKICHDDPAGVELMQGAGYLHVYSFHGRNVWDIEHHLEICRKRSVPRKQLLQYRQRLCRTLDYLRLDDEIDVVGIDGLAFTYRRQDAEG